MVMKLEPREALRDGTPKRDVPRRPSIRETLACPFRKRNPLNFRSETFACPFRKRNPQRFNFRSYPQCSLSPFQSMSLLIEHIRCHHQTSRSGYPSYWKSFAPEKSRDEHLKSQLSCDKHGPLQDGHLVDPEDGITSEVDQSFEAREQSRVVTWKSLWMLLFPGDTEQPPHEFEAPIETDEVQQLFYNERKLRELGRTSQRYMQGPSTQPTSAVVFYFCQMHIIETLHQCRNQRGHQYSADRVRREEECLLSVKHIISSRTVQSTDYSEAPSLMPGVNVSNSRASGATKANCKGSSSSGKEKCMGCPFRKRNPVRFNIRNHQTCALGGFESLSILKRHIIDSHRANHPPSCPRCLEVFEDGAQLEAHLNWPTACKRSVYNRHCDPEDGIRLFTNGCEALFTRSDTSLLNSWEAIWQLLFPDDMCIPASEYEPPTEIDEVEAIFYNEQTLRRLFYGLILVGHDEASIVEYVRQHITEVFSQCRPGSVSRPLPQPGLSGMDIGE